MQQLRQLLVAVLCLSFINPAYANRCEQALDPIYVGFLKDQIQELLDSNSSTGLSGKIPSEKRKINGGVSKSEKRFAEGLSTKEILRARKLLKDPKATREHVELFLHEMAQATKLAQNDLKLTSRNPVKQAWKLAIASTKRFYQIASPAARFVMKVIVLSAVTTPILYILKDKVDVVGQGLTQFMPETATGLFLGSLAVFSSFHVARGVIGTGTQILGEAFKPVISEVKRRYFRLLVGGKDVPLELKSLFRVTWWHSNKILNDVDRASRGDIVEIIRATMAELTKAVGDYRRNSKDLASNEAAYGELVVRTAKFLNRSAHLFPEFFLKLEELSLQYGHKLKNSQLDAKDIEALNEALSRHNFVLIDMLQAAFSYLKLSGEGLSWNQQMKERFVFAEDVIRVSLRMHQVWEGSTIPTIPEKNQTLYLNILKLGLIIYNIDKVKAELKGGPFAGIPE